MSFVFTDLLRETIRDDAIGCFMPGEANYVRVRKVGGEKNHLGELEAHEVRIERVPFTCVDTTGRGELDDSERTERVVGGQSQGERLVILLEDVLRKGDRVERLANPKAVPVDLTDTAEAYEVVIIEEPRLNNEAVSYHVTLREQTD